MLEFNELIEYINKECAEYAERHSYDRILTLKAIAVLLNSYIGLEEYEERIKK